MSGFVRFLTILFSQKRSHRKPDYESQGHHELQALLDLLMPLVGRSYLSKDTQSVELTWRQANELNFANLCSILDRYKTRNSTMDAQRVEASRLNNVFFLVDSLRTLYGCSENLRHARLLSQQKC